jgi:hypothetical protein
MAVIKSGATSDQLTIDATSKAARTTLYDTSGNAIIAGGGLYVNTNKTIYTASTGNSTTAQLASLATFTGTVDDVLSVTHVQLQIVCDQKYTVTVFQYSDAGGTKLVNTKVFRRQANEPTAETIALVSDYYKTSIKNEGASATTTLSSATTLGNFPVTPAGLTNTGNFPVEVPAKATYRASTIVPLVTAVTVSRGIWTMIGSATKTVTVKRIRISGVSIATAVNYLSINLVKNSTATTGGTSTTLVAVPLDSLSAAATAVVKAYTAVATDGALIGNIVSDRVLCPITGTAAALQFAPDMVFNFADIDGSGGIVLRSAAEEIALQYPVAAPTVPTLSIDVEWTEE